MKPKTKQFKCAAVSSNTNSFGLRGHVFIAQDGEAWQVGLNSINGWDKGDVVIVAADGPYWAWYAIGGEIPEKLPDAPKEVVKEVWG